VLDLDAIYIRQKTHSHWASQLLKCFKLQWLCHYIGYLILRITVN